MDEDWRIAGGMDEREEWRRARDVDPGGEDELQSELDDARADAQADGQRTGLRRIPPGFLGHRSRRAL